MEIVYKNFKIESQPSLTMYKIIRIGKGPLPNVMAGLFTSERAAKQAIDMYEPASEKVE